MRKAKRNWTRTILVVLAVVLIVPVFIAGLTVTVGGILSKRALRSEVRDLYLASLAPEPNLVSESELDGLPEPVQRWLRNSNVVGKERVRTVRLRQRGQFRQGEDQPWMPFNAEEYYTTNPPTFLWHAKFKIAGLPVIEVRDSYRGGKGNTLVRLGSVVTIGNVSGPEMNQGAMVRYLSEIIWFPSSALSEYIEWSPIDSSSAKATMSHQGITASALFYFDETGNLINVVADRYRTVGDTFSLDRWSTPITEQGEFDGIRVPIRGEAVWNLESGDFSYIRLEVIEIDHNVPMPY